MTEPGKTIGIESYNIGQIYQRNFPFPTNGIKAEAKPNTEKILIAEFDLSLLRELHEFGSVRNLKDRRKDIYELKK